MELIFVGEQVSRNRMTVAGQCEETFYFEYSLAEWRRIIGGNVCFEQFNLASDYRSRKRTMRNIAPYIVAALMFVVAISAFFVVWANADAIHPPRWSAAAFNVVSFPTFSVIPQRLTNDKLWEFAILNSAFWAVVAAAFARFLLNRKHPNG